MEGAKKDGKNLPVSVKTRIGYNKNELETWLPAILETNPAVVTIHARTRKEMSLVPARWEHVKRAMEIRDGFVDSKGKKSETLIFGNGDALDLEDAEKKAKETGCDGVMLGRAIFGNPWLFSKSNDLENKLNSVKQISVPEKLRVMVEHTKLFEEILPHKNFSIMKKHYKAYVNGWDGAKELRIKLMEAKNAGEVENIVNEYLS
jgi:tRNA-dihydrouridine synthase